MFKRKTTSLTARTVQIALALSATSTALAYDDPAFTDNWDDFGFTVSPEELEPSSAAAADAAADMQDTLALELERYGEASLEITLIDEHGKANLFEMVFNVPDHNDKGSFMDFLIDENFGQEDMEGFTDDFLLDGIGLDRPGESVKGVVIPSEGDGVFGGMGGIPELNTSVEFKRSWDLSAVGPGAVCWQDPIPGTPATSRIFGAFIECVVPKPPFYGTIKQVIVEITREETPAAEPYGADTDGDGKPDSTVPPTTGSGQTPMPDPEPNEGTPMPEPEPEPVEPEDDKDDGKDDHSPDDEESDDSNSNPAPDETGDQIMTQAQKDEFRASVTPDQSAARAVGASLLAIMFRNISNPVPEDRGASSRGTGDLLGDCAGLPPWECSGDTLSVQTTQTGGLVIGTLNSQTSGQSMTGRGSGVPTGPDCDSPNPEDCI
jgi:hypothetical protein